MGKPENLRSIMPRVLRAKDAPHYLGMDRNRFNREIKPYLIAVKIGTQGVGYDRLELDSVWEEYMKRNGRPGALHVQKGEAQWENVRQASSGGPMSQAVSGTSTKSSTASAFAKAVERVTKQKQKAT